LNTSAAVLAKALDKANSELLDNNKSPTRKLGGLDNRGSHFYIALYWAKALAEQDESPELKAVFTSLAQTLARDENVIIQELLAVQGSAVEIGGYYRPDMEKTAQAMRPSATFNAALAMLRS